MTSRNVLRALLAGAVVSLVPAAAEACAVCGLDGPGAIPVIALLFLMATPFVVAGSIGAWLLYVHLRAKGPDRGLATAGRSAWRQGVDLMPRPVFWGGLICIIAGTISVGAWAWLRQGPAVRVGVLNAPQRLEVYGEVPSFSLVAQTGQVVSREAFQGKAWIANFIFTSCRTTCPRQTATMAQLQRDLASEPDVRLVSITVDPDHDTPEVLTGYAERFHVDPHRWLFLTGEEKAIYTLAQNGFHLAAGVVPVEVSTPIEQAFSRASDAPASPPQNDLRRLLPSPIRRTPWSTTPGLPWWTGRLGFADTIPAWTQRPLPVYATT